MKRFLTLVFALSIVLTLTVPAHAGGGTVVAGETRTIGYYGYVDNEGGLWLWGSNLCCSAGQDVSVTRVDKPTKVMDHVVSFARWEQATIVLKDDGSVWTFGNDYARGVVVDRIKGSYIYYKPAKGPEPVKVLDNCVAVAMGQEGQFGALGADGTLYGWGNTHLHGCGAAYGDPGLTDEYMDAEHGTFDVVKPFKLLTNVKWFTMGAWNGMAVKNDGTVWYWGGDSWYENNHNGGDTQRPVQLSGASVRNMKSAVPYNEGAYIIKTDNSCWKWGGWANGKPRNYKDPTKVADDIAMISCTSRGEETLMLKPDGNLFLYDKATGDKQWYSGNVQWIANSFSNGNDNETQFILKNDGTLYMSEPAYVDGKNTHPLQFVASNVALSGKPFSSIQTNKSKTVAGFTDVSEGDWFADSVLWAVQQNITTGTSATTFTPERECTVSEILTFLWRSQGKPAPTIASPFTDVPAGQFYTDAAIWAYEKGLVEGGTFNGGAKCTRAMVVTYLWKLAGSPSTSDHIYDYNDVPSSLKDPVTWATDQNITKGIGQTAFSRMAFGPDMTCSRSQIVTFLYRAYAK